MARDVAAARTAPPGVLDRPTSLSIPGQGAALRRERPVRRADPAGVPAPGEGLLAPRAFKGPALVHARDRVRPARAPGRERLGVPDAGRGPGRFKRLARAPGARDVHPLPRGHPRRGPFVVRQGFFFPALGASLSGPVRGPQGLRASPQGRRVGPPASRRSCGGASRGPSTGAGALLEAVYWTYIGARRELYVAPGPRGAKSRRCGRGWGVGRVPDGTVPPARACASHVRPHSGPWHHKANRDFRRRVGATKHTECKQPAGLRRARAGVRRRRAVPAAAPLPLPRRLAEGGPGRQQKEGQFAGAWASFGEASCEAPGVSGAGGPARGLFRGCGRPQEGRELRADRLDWVASGARSLTLPPMCRPGLWSRGRGRGGRASLPYHPFCPRPWTRRGRR